MTEVLQTNAFYGILFALYLIIKNGTMRTVAWCLLLLAILFAAISNRLEGDQFEKPRTETASALP